jgi:phosphopantothenoylcysteine decarboxylase/phosphopantothenate--cysteine ligase
MLKGKNILIGITGSIAAYKVAILVRGLTKLEANVKIIMTKDSNEFITPLTLSTLSNNPVLIDWKDQNDNWNNHVDLGLWADLFLIAPATANTLAKMNTGLCDNLLMATYLSAKCPIAFAPAMDLDMYQHFSTQQNISNLVNQGYHLIDSEEGELASGLVGKGRMAEPDTILSFTRDFFSSEKKKLKGKKVLITAGPTFENIDPVRFIGNNSSGKMGLEIALESLRLGAETNLIMGPNSLNIPSSPNLNVTQVRTAEEMFQAVKSNYQSMDIGVFSAAVADYKPKTQASQKIKKKEEELEIKLVKNQDILKFVGDQKKDYNYKLVGFALETNNEIENAKSKLKKKNLDYIVLNSLNDKGAGFSGGTNKILIIDNHNKITRFELKTKAEVAKDILKTITDED